jgi:hypothetical protein
MALPDNFSPWEHLQDTLRRVHNRRVKKEFRDLDEGFWDDLSISTGRRSLATACVMQDKDTSSITIIRMILFYVVLGQATAMLPPMYGIPTELYQQSVEFKPQIKLFFREDVEDTDTGYRPIEAELSFRLMNESSETVSSADAMRYANKIKTEFAGGGGYRWQKGRLKLSYRDLARGYQLIVTPASEAGGKEVINKILDIQGHSLDELNLTTSKLGQNPPTIPANKFVYGKSRRMPRKRPVGWVRFQYAELHIWGLPKAIVLVDRTGRKANPLVSI